MLEGPTQYCESLSVFLVFARFETVRKCDLEKWRVLLI